MGHRSGILEEFLAFMAAQGLSPGEAISAKALRACADNKRELKRDSAFRKLMRRYCEKLKNNYEWKDIPDQYRGTNAVYDSLGRCAVVFSNEDGWRPAIALGFYYSSEDHRVEFVDRKKGIDLSMRVHAPPDKNPSLDRVLKLLKSRVKALQKLGGTVHLKGDPGNGNAHTLLMVQKSLLDVIDGIDDDEEQVAAMHAELSR
jgi:hypothetical protein